MRPVGLSIIRFLTTVACFGALGEGHQRPVLSRIPPEGDAFEGDTVTLVCQVEGNPEEWEYLWYKDRILDRKTETPPINTSYIISPASLSDNGEYRCLARRKDDRTTQYYSTSIGLQVSELFTRPSLTAPLWNPVWERESFTLQCQVQLNNRRKVTDIRYLFIKEGKELESAGLPGNYTTSAARAEDAGRYECQLETGGVRKASDSVEVNVRAGVPRTTLTAEPPWGEMFVGERVSLTCLVEGDSAGWKYLWYKDSQTTPLPQPENSSDTGARYTISAAALPHSGEYWCRAARGAAYFHSDYSKAARLKVSDASVILQTPPQPLTEGDKLTLLCRARDTKVDPKRITFEYYKNNETLEFQPSTGVTIPAVMKKDAGLYKCFAYSKSRVLGESEVEVSVRNFFARVTLTASPGPAVMEGEPVNLTCEVERNTYLSPPVNYTFLRDGAPLAASSGTAQYFITAMNKTHTGRYSCTAETWPGIRKQSAAVKIELANPWWRSIAIEVARWTPFLILLAVLVLFKCRNHRNAEETRRTNTL
ncbi:obscurin-like [Huso huso]|uniref:Obscurin-like n=1 Tax=Huso huso TaxID=61971 RepID=A0ABR0Y5R1_HUSHU